jgi:hypothetical protein
MTDRFHDRNPGVQNGNDRFEDRNPGVENGNDRFEDRNREFTTVFSLGLIPVQLTPKPKTKEEEEDKKKQPLKIVEVNQGIHGVDTVIFAPETQRISLPNITLLLDF